MIRVPIKEVLPGLLNLLRYGHGTFNGVTVSCRITTARKLFVEHNSYRDGIRVRGEEPFFLTAGLPDGGEVTATIENVAVASDQITEAFHVSQDRFLAWWPEAYWSGHEKQITVEWNEAEQRIDATVTGDSQLRVRRLGRDAVLTRVTIQPDGTGVVEIDGLPDQSLLCV